jgi:hypothetical protein
MQVRHEVTVFGEQGQEAIGHIAGFQRAEAKSLEARDLSHSIHQIGERA